MDLQACKGPQHIELAVLHSPKERSKENRPMLLHQGLKLQIGKNFLTVGLIKHWNELPGEIVQSTWQSLKM